MSYLVFLLVSSVSWTLFDLARKKLALNEQPLALTIAFNVGAFPLYLCAWWLSQEGLSVAGYWQPSIIAASFAAIAAVGFVTALKLGDVSRVVPVLALTPVISTLAAGMALGESLTLMQWIAMLVMVVAIAGAQGGIKHIRSKPFVLMLLVSFCWGVGIVFDKLALQHSGPLFHGVIQTLLVAVALLVFALMTKRSAIVQSPLYRLLPALLLFVLAVVTQWWALAGLDTGIVETVKRSVGIVGALLGGVMLFRERLSIYQTVWCCVILLGIPVVLQPDLH